MSENVVVNSDRVSEKATETMPRINETDAQRLARLRAERAERRDKMQAKYDAEEARLNIEAELKKCAEDEKWDELATRYGQRNLLRFDAKDGRMVVFGRPPFVHYRKFLNLKHASCDAVLPLLEASLAYPANAAFHDILEEYPGLIMQAIAGITAMVRAAQEDDAGK